MSIPSNGAETYFAQPSTRWDIVKFAFPILLGLAFFAAALYYSNEAQGQEIALQTADLRDLRSAKEDSAARLLVLENQIKEQNVSFAEIKTDLRETRADIKTLLARFPAGR